MVKLQETFYGGRNKCSLSLNFKESDEKETPHCVFWNFTVKYVQKSQIYFFKSLS